MESFIMETISLNIVFKVNPAQIRSLEEQKFIVSLAQRRRLKENQGLLFWYMSLFLHGAQFTGYAMTPHPLWSETI